MIRYIMGNLCVKFFEEFDLKEKAIPVVKNMGKPWYSYMLNTVNRWCSGKLITRFSLTQNQVYIVTSGGMRQHESLKQAQFDTIPNFGTLNQIKPNLTKPADGTCLPVKHFVMTKIEKTGSSTLFSVFARFTQNNKLNILTQTKGWHIDWRTKRHEGWEIGPQHVNVTDVLINHARYDETIFNEYMPSDFKWIVPIREPESWFKSAAEYYPEVLTETLSYHNPESVIKDGKLMYMERSDATGVLSFYHLPQLQWLGLDYHKHKDNITAIKEYVDYIMPKIDIPMLSDQFDASLVLLRRRLCWNYPDSFYQSYEVTHSKRKTISEAAREKLLSEKVNLGEKLLYDRMNQTWWSSPEIKESDFWFEVKYFKELNSEVTHNICNHVVDSQQSQAVPASQWHPSFHVTPLLCDFLNMTKVTIVNNTGTWALDELFQLNAGASLRTGQTKWAGFVLVLVLWFAYTIYYTMYY